MGIREHELFGPTREFFQEFAEENGFSIEDWYIEPAIRVRKRQTHESPAKVMERPDIVCKTTDFAEGELFWIFELKTQLNKKSIGQIFTYHWAIQNGVELLCNGETVENLSGSTEDKLVIISGENPTSEYYLDVVDHFNAQLSNVEINPQLIPV